MQFFCVAAALVGMASPIQADQQTRSLVKREQVRVLPVARTPESDSVILTLVIPKSEEVVTEDPVWVQFRIEQYALGVGSSQFDRENELALSPLGQTVHLIVDNNSYIPINEPAINPFNEDGDFRITYYKVSLPDALKEGVHTLRLFPTRSFGESLKGSNTFQAINFYVGSAGQEEPDLSKPYLTYNEPSDAMELTVDKPVLLDFLVANCELSPDGFKVRLSIDGKVNRVLSSLQPYYIYGLPKGTHTIRLELLDEGGKLISGPFNDTKRTIRVR